MNKKIAALDVGSNTVLMLVAEVDADGNARIVRDEHSIARLGENVNKTGKISPEAIARALPIFRKYGEICRQEGVAEINAVATSAVRDASNKADFLPLFADALGSEIHVIPGETEAELSFLGSVEDVSNSTIIDIGGGSTEFINGENSQIKFKTSLNFGAVKLTEQFFSSHPPKANIINQAEEFLLKCYEPLPDSIFRADKVYSVAGTPTSIAAIYQNIREFDYDKIHLFSLSPQIVDEVFELVMAHSLEELIEKYNIHPKRVDILPAGILILKTVMKRYNLPKIIVSAKGLRFGVMTNMLTKQINIG